MMDDHEYEETTVTSGYWCAKLLR